MELPGLSPCPLIRRVPARHIAQQFAGLVALFAHKSTLRQPFPERSSPCGSCLPLPAGMSVPEIRVATGWPLLCPWQPELAAAHLLRPLAALAGRAEEGASRTGISTI